MTEILSTLIKNMYLLVNSPEDQKISLQVIDSLTGKMFDEDYFQTKSAGNFPEDTRYFCISSKQLPKIVNSVYSLQNNRTWSPEKVNISFKGNIDVARLDELVDGQMPDVNVIGKQSRRDYLSAGERILHISSSSYGVKRMIFIPYKDNGIWLPYQEALNIVDMVFDKVCFVPARRETRKGIGEGYALNKIMASAKVLGADSNVVVHALMRNFKS